MATTWIQDRIVRPLTHRVRGNKATYQATWFVETSEPCAGAVAQSLAQISGTVPAQGDTLVWSFHGDSFTDTSVYALDFSADAVTGLQEASKWHITVGWRQPDPGSPGEQPGYLDQPPLSRPDEHWIEYDYYEAETWLGRKVTYTLDENFNIAVSSVADPQIMLNTAASPLPSVRVLRLRPVLVAARNVRSPLDGLERNVRFELTTNNAEYTVTMRTGTEQFTWDIPAYKSRFLKSETGPPIYEQGQVYHRMETRIEVSDLPYVIERLNEGHYYLALPRTEEQAALPPDDRKRPFRDGSGVLIREPQPLKEDGTRFAERDPNGQAGGDFPEDYHTLYFMTLRPVDYSSLV